MEEGSGRREGASWKFLLTVSTPARRHMNTSAPCARVRVERKHAAPQGRQTLRNMPAQPQLPAKHDDQRAARESCRVGVAAVKCKHFQGGGVARTHLLRLTISSIAQIPTRPRGVRNAPQGQRVPVRGDGTLIPADDVRTLPHRAALELRPSK